MFLFTIITLALAKTPKYAELSEVKHADISSGFPKGLKKGDQILSYKTKTGETISEGTILKLVHPSITYPSGSRINKRKRYPGYLTVRGDDKKCAWSAKEGIVLMWTSPPFKLYRANKTGENLTVEAIRVGEMDGEPYACLEGTLSSEEQITTVVWDIDLAFEKKEIEIGRVAN